MNTPTNTDILAVPCLRGLDDMQPDDVIAALDERGVRRPIEHVTDAAYPYRPLATFAMAHTDSHLYIDFFVRCNFLRAVNYRTNTAVHEDSAVAAMFQPNVGNPTFYVFTFNCIGAMSGVVVGPDGAGKELDPRRLEAVQRMASCGTRPFQELEGMFTWNILVALPLSLLGIPGSSWPLEIKGNFFKCATATSQPHFLSWLPVEGQFPTVMAPERAGRIILD